MYILKSNYIINIRISIILMKKLLFIPIVLIFLQSFSQTSTVYDQLFLKSTVLKSERKFALYLPPGYKESSRSYPVLYLLHGSGDDQTGWIQFGEVQHITDKAIANGTATPMIIVMPDANTTKRGYFNRIDKKWSFEDYFFKELIPFIEENYRVKPSKQFRAIAGLSMGGGGTFMYALHKPNMFSSACPLSAATYSESIEGFKKRYIENSFKYTSEEITSYYKQHNVISLINNLSVGTLNSVRWYIDCGDDDFLYEGNSLVHILLRKKGVKHEFRIRNGAHNWTYWRASLPKVLEFTSQGFHQY